MGLLKALATAMTDNRMTWMKNIISMMAIGAGLLCGNLVAAPAESEMVLKYHFSGTDNIYANPNAAKLKQIGTMSETILVRDDVLGKLSHAPAQLFANVANTKANDGSAL